MALLSLTFTRSVRRTLPIAGAGLDVTDPEPLPEGHALTKMANVVLTPHTAGESPGAADRKWRLIRENVRRFARGEPVTYLGQTVQLIREPKNPPRNGLTFPPRGSAAKNRSRACGQLESGSSLLW